MCVYFNLLEVNYRILAQFYWPAGCFLFEPGLTLKVSAICGFYSVLLLFTVGMSRSTRSASTAARIRSTSCTTKLRNFENGSDSIHGNRSTSRTFGDAKTCELIKIGRWIGFYRKRWMSVLLLEVINLTLVEYPSLSACPPSPSACQPSPWVRTSFGLSSMWQIGGTAPLHGIKQGCELRLELLPKLLSCRAEVVVESRLVIGCTTFCWISSISSYFLLVGS